MSAKVRKHCGKRWRHETPILRFEAFTPEAKAAYPNGASKMVVTGTCFRRKGHKGKCATCEPAVKP